MKDKIMMSTTERLRRLKEVDLIGLKPMVKSIYKKQIIQCEKEIKKEKEKFDKFNQI